MITDSYMSHCPALPIPLLTYKGVTLISIKPQPFKDLPFVTLREAYVTSRF